MTAAADGRSGELVAARRTGAQARAPGLLTRLRRDALQALAAGPLYRHTLIGRVPSDLKFRIALHWPGDARRGAAIIGGEIELAGEVVRAPSPRWAPTAVGPDWLAMRLFAWLAHFDEIAKRDQDDPLRHSMLTSIIAQLRHLARTTSWQVA